MFKRCFSSITAVFCLGFLLTAGVTGQKGENGISRISNDGGSVSWQILVPHESVSLSVSTPDGSVFSREFKSGQNPVFIPTDDNGEFYGNGTFNYQLVITPVISPDVKSELAAARARGKSDAAAAEFRRRGDLPSITSDNGSFKLINGQIFTANDGTVEPAPLRSEPRAPEPGTKTEPTGKAGGTESLGGDFVINQDLIVDGSACIGFDCVNGLSFGFDTLILKENNTRLLFDDTSTVSSFPRNDWRLTANDSSNGGQERFSVEDPTNGKVPFTIEGNATTNSLYVDSTSRIGFKTNTPVVELHVKDGDSPTLRLEQDGSSGFTPQTWDVAGNETNFFVRDATNGSQLPFRIRPSAPSNSIFVDTDGDIGMGTSSPTANARLHIVASAGAGANNSVLLENNGPARIALFNSAASNAGDNQQTWILNSNNTFRIGAGTTFTPLTLNTAGDLTVTGTVTAMGGATLPDYVFEPDYRLMPIMELAEFVAREKHLPNVPSASEVEEKGLNMTNMQHKLLEKVEELTLYTIEQQKVLDAQKLEAASLKAEIEDLRALVKKLAKN